MIEVTVSFLVDTDDRDEAVAQVKGILGPLPADLDPAHMVESWVALQTSLTNGREPESLGEWPAYHPHVGT